MTRVLPDLPGTAGALDAEADLAAALGQLVADLHREQGGAEGDAPLVRAAATIASLATAAGHSCVPLDRAHEIAPAQGAWPAAAAWREALTRSPMVRVEPGEPRLAPLVLDGDRLYLQRYWRHEADLAERLRALHRPLADADPDDARIDRWFERNDAAVLAQRRAAKVAASRGLCVITGGPGTGKTTTMVRALAALVERHPDLRIALAAPTGKAAARMDDAIRAQLGTLDTASDAVRNRLSAGAQTLHRLLGSRPGRVSFRHGPDAPLPYDVVVVDEASMVDLGLAARLLAAIRPGARLVLLGDQDQLASVEAGSVFAQICIPDGRLADAVVRLEHSFRFAGGGGIGRLAKAVNAGEAEAAQAVLREAHAVGPVDWEAEVPDAEALAARLIEGYHPYVEAIRGGASPVDALAALERFRVLCALRVGPQGAAALNEALAAEFHAATGLAGAVPRWYAGRPVMVTANDYELQLFNGDVGVALPDDRGRLQVHFPQAGGGTRAVATIRVPSSETAFAMTVHKAQGSEFARVELVLPSRDHPLLTRELLYTGLTRARDALRVWASPAVLAAAIGRPTVRYSGLAARIEAL